MSIKGVFAALASKMRRMSVGLREKPSLEIDDFVMEHFLLYNGLIGSMPDNQPDYTDVRNDIVQAINDASAHQLAIALKLSPLWWEDRLEKIFFAIGQINPEGAIELLLAERPDDDSTGDTTPLSHSDWRVRANAARLLAVLEASDGVPKLAEMLAQDHTEQKSVFCHYAVALARLGTDEARQALLAQVNQEEPWFRVDLVHALAHWELEQVAHDLMKVMLAGCEFDDYMAVAISRRHKPSAFIEFEDEQILEGLAELSLALVKGFNGPFHSEQTMKGELKEISEKINRLALEKPTPRRLAAAIELNSYLGTAHFENTRIDDLVRDLSRKKHYEVVKKTLENPSLDKAAQIGEVKHALSLVAKFKLTELAPNLIPMLDADSPVLSELAACVASLRNLEAAPKLAQLVEGKIDLKQRCQQVLSAHPVLESDVGNVDFYWNALKAMGSLPDKSSLDILSLAVNDFAPDKREQALLSLQSILLSEDLRKEYKGDLLALIKERIDDPSPHVQAAALAGVAQHNLADLIPEVLKLLHSKESVVHRNSMEALKSLADNGHENAVKSAMETSMSKELDNSKKRRLNSALVKIVGP